MQVIQHIETILFVFDQQRSTAFYSRLFRMQPNLHVPGMTEFNLMPGFKLGLMPNTGMAKILSDKTPHPGQAIGIPRCELYLIVEDISIEFDYAITAGAKLISPILDRDWGDKACYFADPDGHIIAFAEKLR